MDAKRRILAIGRHICALKRSQYVIYFDCIEYESGMYGSPKRGECQFVVGVKPPDGRKTFEMDTEEIPEAVAQSIADAIAKALNACLSSDSTSEEWFYGCSDWWRKGDEDPVLDLDVEDARGKVCAITVPIYYV